MSLLTRLYVRYLTLLLLACCLLPAASTALARAFPPDTSTPPSPWQPGAGLVRFEHLEPGDGSQAASGQQNGLSQSVVTTVLQDRYGYMWLGTQDGLNKYDGYQFTVYRQSGVSGSTIVGESLPDGNVSGNIIWSLYEDHAGRLWVGSSGGLDLLDRASGKFIHYWPLQPSLYNPSFEDDVEHIQVRSILEDRSGMLWLGTNGAGLVQLDPVKLTANRYKFVYETVAASEAAQLAEEGGSNTIYALLEDQQGVLWLGTGRGLAQLGQQNGAVALVVVHLDAASPGMTLGQSDLEQTAVRALCEDAQGRLWVGTEGSGLFLLHPGDANATGSNGFRPVHFMPTQANPSSLSGNVVRALLSDNQGRLWVGTQSGLDLYNPFGSYFLHFQHNPLDPYSLSSGAVSSLYEDRSGGLWAGMMGSGINRLDYSAHKFALYRHIPSDANSLGENIITAVAQDRAGNIWVGTSQQGLDRVERDPPGVLAPPDGAVPSPDAGSTAGPQAQFSLPGLESGLVRSVRHYQALFDGSGSPAAGGLSSNTVTALLVDQVDNLWAATDQGLHLFNASQEVFIKILSSSQDGLLSESSNAPIISLHETTDPPALWLGSYGGGLAQVVRQPDGSLPGTGAAIEVDLVSFRHDAADAASLSDDRVSAIHQDAQGNLWVGTLGGGVSVLGADATCGLEQIQAGLPCAPVFRHYRNDPDNPASLGENTIFAIYVSRYGTAAGTVWVGTWEGGLNRYNPTADNFTRFTEQQGLPDNTVYAIQEDEQGGLWISSDRGLYRFDPEMKQVRRFGVEDGLQGNEFTSGAAWRGLDGELFFGGVSGLNAFFPQRVIGPSYTAPIVIGAFSLFNRVERRDMVSGETIDLSYDENFISFDFAALDFNGPQRIQYAYQMEGLDETWVLAGSRRHVDYPNLRPGNYVFRIRGTDSEGLWVEGVSGDDAAAWVYVIVHPPFWGTWWFQVGLSLALIGAAAGGYRLRVSGLERRSRELEAQVEQRTKELSTLLETSQSVLSTISLQPLLDLILDRLNAVVSYNMATILLLESETDGAVPAIQPGASSSPASSAQWLRVLAYRGPETQPDFRQHLRLLSDTPGYQQVLLQRAPVVLQSPGSRAAGFVDASLAPQSEAASRGPCWMGIPLIAREQVIGLLSISHNRSDCYTEQTARLALAFANQAAIALENAHLFARAERRTRDVQALYQADEELLRHLDMDDVMQALVEIAVQALGAEKSAILAWEQKKDGEFSGHPDPVRRLKVRAARGFQAETVERMSAKGFAANEGTVGRVAASGEAVVVNDVGEATSSVQAIIAGDEDFLRENIHSFMHIPIQIKDQVFGVFSVDYQRPNAFGSDEIRLFQALVQRASLAIENAQLYEQAQTLAAVEERQRLARELHDAVTQTLFSANLIADVLPELWHADPAEGAQMLKELRQLSKGALAEMRTLLLELRPAALERASLATLLRQLADAASARLGFPVEQEYEVCQSLPKEVHIVFYRVAQEALNNIIRHAGAGSAHPASQVRLALRAAYGMSTADASGTGVELVIEDDGGGFERADIGQQGEGLPEPAVRPADGFPAAKGLGLQIMQERAQVVGAELEITSRLNQGTRIRLMWPEHNLGTGIGET